MSVRFIEFKDNTSASTDQGSEDHGTGGIRLFERRWPDFQSNRAVRIDAASVGSKRCASATVNAPNRRLSRLATRLCHTVGSTNRSSGSMSKAGCLRSTPGITLRHRRTEIRRGLPCAQHENVSPATCCWFDGTNACPALGASSRSELVGHANHPGGSYGYPGTAVSGPISAVNGPSPKHACPLTRPL